MLITLKNLQQHSFTVEIDVSNTVRIFLGLLYSTAFSSVLWIAFVPKYYISTKHN